MDYMARELERNVSVEPFHPGEYIADELEARGWTQDDLAEVLGCNRHTVMRLLNHKSGITADMAVALSKAFGTSAEMWMNLQSSYELAAAAVEDREIERRAMIFLKTPIRDIKKRGWIEDAGTADDLEKAVCTFLQIPSIDAEPQFSVAARKSTSYSSDTPAQIAWFARTHFLDHAAPAYEYKEENLEPGIVELLKLAAYPEDVRRVPRVLADIGIRLLLIERLPKSLVDGVAFWINDGKSPVIALSLRFDRIDNFWHNLLHEIVHIKHRDNSPVDSNLFSDGGEEELPLEEKRANAEACNYLIPVDRLDSFIMRKGRACYESDIVRAAQVFGVHPGILTGQLHGRKALDYKFQRKLLVKIRDHIIGQAITDGWNNVPNLKKGMP